MKKYPKPRRFVPKHPEKYLGDVNNIICRSGLELRYFKYFDETPSVLSYSSEELVIKYYFELDRKVHRYFPDFVIKVKNKNGEINTIVVEIKPSSETVAPRKGKKRPQTYLNEVFTWEKNQAKWKYARAFCEANGLQFRIWTEKEIKLSWGKK